MGVVLFIRNTHGVTLSESGQELLPLARQAVRDVNACADRIAEMKGTLTGELNIGMTYTLEPYMRATMLQYLKSYPDVKLNAHYRNLPDLLGKLHAGQIDIMLSMMPTSPHEFVESIPLMSYRLTAIMRKTHHLADKKELTFQDLHTQGLILPEKGIRDRNAIESYIHTPTGPLNIRALVNDANAILNLLEESKYVSVLAENIIEGRPQLCSVPIAELSTPIPIYAHFNKDMTRKRSAEVFLDMFRKTSVFFMQAHPI